MVRVEMVHKAVRTLGTIVVTSSRCSTDKAEANCGDGTTSGGDAAALSATTQLPQTDLWHVKCLKFCSVCSTFGPALPPSPCLLLLRWLLPLLYLVPSATAPFPSKYSALSSAASCCRTFLRALLLLVHSLNKMRTLIPAWSRML